MADHEAHCAIELGYNHCTCIACAEEQVARGFALHLDRSGQVGCPSGHEEWWLGAHRCPWCRAAL